MGEAAARLPFLAGGNAEGAKDPPWISPKKRPALKSQTEENATPPGKYYYEMDSQKVAEDPVLSFRSVGPLDAVPNGSLSFRPEKPTVSSSF